MSAELTSSDIKALEDASWQGGRKAWLAAIEDIVAARIAQLEAQVAGLEAMNTEKAAEIRRLRMGNHPAGRALRVADEAAWGALREALTERDAEHVALCPACGEPAVEGPTDSDGRAWCGECAREGETS